jgi:hypothetical protein
MDPYEVLGVRPGTPERELASAYRDLAKRWHPDRGAGDEGERRMAEINVAYDVLRAGSWQERSPVAPPVPSRDGRGHWLQDAIRRALGRELLDALDEGEEVRLVTPASTWASPRAILVVTERRLLWLLDDVPVARVRTLRFRDVATVEHRVRRPRRREATLIVHSLGGRRHVFHGLRAHTAATVARQVRPH